MKQFLFIALIASSFSCARKIGDLTVISTRNFDSKTDYIELKRYVKSKGTTIESAIEKAVRGVPGGEFMKNVTIYSNGKIEGDVWGVGVISQSDKNKQAKAQDQAAAKTQEQQITAAENAKFDVNDKVLWKDASKFNKTFTGIIIGKDDE